MATPISRRTVLAAGAGAAAGLAARRRRPCRRPPTTSVGFTAQRRGARRWRAGHLDHPRHRPARPDRPGQPDDRHLQRARQGHQPDPPRARRPDLQRVRPGPPGDRRPARPPRQHRARPELRRGPGRRRHPRLHREQGPQRAARPRLHHHPERPDRLRNGRSVTISSFVQGRLSNPEVDAFSYHISGSGMKYRLYSPTRAAATPLHRTGQAPARRLAARRGRGRLAARQLLRQRDHAAGQPRCAGLRHPAGTTDLLRRLRRGPAEHVLLARGRPPLRPAHPRDHPRSRAPVPHRP